MTSKKRKIIDDALAVKSFYEETRETKCPATPKELTKDSVKFITRMVLSELSELACTVSESTEEAVILLEDCLNEIDGPKMQSPDQYHTRTNRIAAQADAFVDIYYYMLDTAAKHGINLTPIFQIVHEANMAKRDPDTQKFIKRESDGKVMKPKGWIPPDVEGEIERQIKEGSWE